MRFPGELVRGTLLRRYKRFLADVQFEDGSEITVHCPNTGAMSGCAISGSAVWLSRSDNPKRKYSYTWELVDTPQGLACIHSALANKVVGEALRAGQIPELSDLPNIKSEVRAGERKSRLDFALDDGQQTCMLEVKCVTLGLAEGGGAFPDAVSDRARRHIDTLVELKGKGNRAVLFFCVFHSGIQWVQPATHIDPAYAEALTDALTKGVEVLAYNCKISPQELILNCRLPFREK